MADGNRLHRAALFYAVKLGWPVFPLWPGTKKPITEHGFLEATTDVETINRWWKDHPNANIGVRTGVKFWVLDGDPRNGCDESLMQLVARHTGLADTLQQLTGGGGWQRFYALVEGVKIGCHTEVWPGIDVKGVGGYVVVPPSIHPSGRPYVWDGSEPPHKQPINPANPWLIPEILAAVNGHHAEQPPFELPPKLEKGSRHPHLFKMGCAMRRKGAGRDEVFAVLVEINQSRCEPPYEREHLEKLADDICKRYAAGDPPKPPTPKPAPKGPTPIECDASLEVYHADMPEPEAIIEDILYPGLTILGGRPKVGKSWFALQLALALVSGETLGGYLAVKKRSRVLYVSLEDRKHQIRSRLRKLTAPTDGMKDLGFVFSLDPILTGGLASLDQYLTDHPAEVVVVDSLLAAVKQAKREHVDVMQADYNIVNHLRDLATKHSLALVVVAHTRKAAGDFLDLIQGTSGTTAAADAVWVLQRTPEGAATLSVTGREVGENVYGLKRDPDFPAWIITGEGDEVAQSESRRDVIELLRDDGPMKPSKIAQRLRKSISGVHRLLAGLCMSGLVVRTSYGTYMIPKPGQTNSPESPEEYVQ